MSIILSHRPGATATNPHGLPPVAGAQPAQAARAAEVKAVPPPAAQAVAPPVRPAVLEAKADVRGLPPVRAAAPPVRAAPRAVALPQPAPRPQVVAPAPAPALPQVGDDEGFALVDDHWDMKE